MSLRQSSLVLAAIMMLALAGCGGGKKAISVSLTSSASAIDQGQTATLNATVTNDSTNAGVSFGNPSCSAASCGALSGATTASATYTAPAEVTSSLTVTITVTSAKDATKSAQVTITVNPNPSVNSATLPNATIGVAYSQTLTASNGVSPYSNFTVSSGALPNGLALSGAGVISGTPTCPVASDNPFAVTVKDAVNVTSAPQNFDIAMNSQALAIAETSLRDAIVGQAYLQQLHTTGGTCAAVTWSLAVGSTLPSWLTLDATGLLHGTPTEPAAAASFTVLAADGTSSPTQALSITVNSAGVNNAALNGRYAFTLQGFDSNGNLVTMAGSLVADGNGSITGGLEDRFAGDGTSVGGALTGFYAVGADDRGTITLTASQESHTFAFALGQFSSGVAALGRVIESDTELATGVMKKQDTSAFSTFGATAASFAFGGRGQNGNGRTAVAGQVSLNGSGSVSGAMDFADTTQIMPNQTIAGSYTVGDTTNGRGTITFTSPGSSQFAFYIVSADEVFIIDSNPTGANDAPLTMSGLKQAASFPAHTNGSVSVLSLDAISHNCAGGATGSRAELDFLQWGAAGNLTVVGDDNDCGTPGTNASQAFTYTVAANGRVTISGGAGVPVIYLVNSTQGFLVGTETSEVMSGSFDPQAGSNFSNSSVSGTFIFGNRPLVVNGGNISSGVATLDGAGSVSVTSDNNSGGTTQTETASDTFSVSANGRTTTSDSVAYVVSSSKAVLIDGASGNDPRITVIEK